MRFLVVSIVSSVLLLLQPSPSQSLPIKKRNRSGRRNNKLLSFFETADDRSDNDEARYQFIPDDDNAPQQQPVVKKQQHQKRREDDSPITYIKMPASPYTFLPGQGYVSQPNSNNPLMLFGTAAASDNVFSVLPPPPSEESRSSNAAGKKNKKNKNKKKKDKIAAATESKIYNLDFLSSIAKVNRPKVTYLSNARPFNIWSLEETSTTSTTTTTTTTEEATTEAPTEDQPQQDNSDDKKEENKKNSPIVWLGKYLFNGLPTSISEFKSPFSPLYWLDSLKDSKYPSTKLFNNLF